VVKVRNGFLFVAGVEGQRDDGECDSSSGRGAEKGPGQTHGHTHHKESHVNKGDKRRQQLHHDGPRVRAVQAFEVQVLLLRLLMLYARHFRVQCLKMFLEIC